MNFELKISYNVSKYLLVASTNKLAKNVIILIFCSSFPTDFLKKNFSNFFNLFLLNENILSNLTVTRLDYFKKLRFYLFR